MDNLRAIVVVRKDLSRSQQTVQAGHALAELAFNAGSRKDEKFKEWVKNHKTLIILGAKDAKHLEDIHSFVEERFIHHMFYEPDMNGEPTALAIYPGTAADLDPHFASMKLA